MAAPLITAITTVPNRANATNQASFSNDVDTFFSQVDEFQTQANTQAQYVNTRANDANSSASASAASALQASGYASTAIDARDAAISSAVYKGTWEGKTSAGVVGESYSYQGSYIYRLNVNLTNISTSTPSPTNPHWQLINVVPFQAPCKPTLKLDFANQDFEIYSKQEGFVKKPLADIVTQGRSTAGTSTDAIGGVTEFAAGQNRFEFDGETGEAKGYLSEETRTRLNTIYIAPTANENITTTARSYTISMWGAGTITLSGSYTGTLVGVDQFTRATLTFTATSGTLTLAYSGTCLNVQLEAGSFATSLIQGLEGTAVTRSADAMTRTLGQEWNPNEGTFVVEFDLTSRNLEDFQYINGIAENVSNITIFFHLAIQDGVLRLRANHPSVGIMQTTIFGFLPESKNKACFSYYAGGFSISLNGRQVQNISYNNVAMIASNQNMVYTVGNRPDGQRPFKGVISKQEYYPRAFDALTLQRLSRI